MNINELKQSIFEAVINNGVESSKADIFGDNPILITMIWKLSV